jgi:Flp pilus assembly protein CpaB
MNARGLMMMLMRVPPHAMFLLILALAASTAWSVTNLMDKQKHDYQGQLEGLLKKANEAPKVVYVNKEPVKEQKVEPSFEATLKPGYRAVSIPVDNANSSAHFITPGSHVDIMVITGSGREAEATAILSDIEVVAAGNSFEKGTPRSASEPVGSVTVAVTPPDAGKLLRAQVAGRLYLTLRSEKDHAPLVVTDLRKAQSQVSRVSIPAPPPVALALPAAKPIASKQPLPAPSLNVETWAGTKKDVVSFRKGSDNND